MSDLTLDAAIGRTSFLFTSVRAARRAIGEVFPGRTPDRRCVVYDVAVEHIARRCRARAGPTRHPGRGRTGCLG